MTQGTLKMDVRKPSDAVAVIDIQGDVTAASEDVLMQAYTEATEGTPSAVVLNFEGLAYMNSGGIGLLVTLLVRANRSKQQLLACGLNEHYQQIFELTRLDEAIQIYGSEQEALASAGA